MSDNTQNEPVQDGSDDASQQERIDGIVEQVRSDARLGNVDDVSEVLRQRLVDAGIAIDEDEFAALVRRVS